MLLLMASAHQAFAQAPVTPSGAWDFTITSGITVGWNVSSGATSYNIYRSTTSGAEAAPKIGSISPGSANRYNDMTVTAGVTYYYKVTAVNGSGESAMSMETSATAGATRIANAPVLTASPGDASVNLTWTAVTGASSYMLGRLIGGTYIYQPGLTGTQFTDSGLSNGTAYTYTLIPSGSAGIGASTSVSNAVTATPTPIATLAFSNVPGETTPGTAFTVTVTAKLANGNTATTYSGTVQLTSNDTGASLGNITLVNGLGSYTTASLATVGLETITATDATYPTVTNSIGVYVAPDLTGGQTSEVYIDNTPGWSTSPAGLSTLAAGTTYYAHIAVVNTSGGNWTSQAGYYLRTTTIVNTCPVWSLGVNPPLNTTILPGHTLHFDFPIVTPHAAGTYGFQWNLVVGNAQTYSVVVSGLTLTSPPYSSPAPTTLTVLSTNILDGTVQLTDWPTQMTVGDRYDVSVTLSNSGTKTMTPGDGLLVGLVPQTGSPVTTWGVASTFGSTVYNGVTVPNDIPPSSLDNVHSVIRIPIIAPSTPGTYHMQWQLEQIVNGVATTFGTPSLDVPVTVVSTSGSDSGSCTGQTVPATVKGGTRFPVSLTFHNTGTTTWTAEHHYCIFTLGYSWLGLTAPVPTSVPPGDSVTFNFTATAPAYVASGNNVYPFQWNLESNCVGFGTPSSLTNITVTP